MQDNLLLDRVDTTVLTPLVCRLLNDDTAIDWSWNSIFNPVSVVTSGVYRFSGNVLMRGEQHPWPLILKIAASFEGTAVQQDYL